MMRRLDPKRDEHLIREALAWVNDQPRFFRDADKAFGNGDADYYLNLMRTEPQIDFGVFDGEMKAMITVSLVGQGVFDSHLLVRRGTNPELVAKATIGVLKGLFEGGMKEGWSWVARKNYGLGRILEVVGMRKDGLTKFKGQSHEQPIEWVRYSVRVI